MSKNSLAPEEGDRGRGRNPLKQLGDNLRRNRGCPVPCGGGRAAVYLSPCGPKFHPARQLTMMEDDNAQFTSTQVCRASGNVVHHSCLGTISDRLCDGIQQSPRSEIRTRWEPLCS